MIAVLGGYNSKTTGNEKFSVISQAKFRDPTRMLVRTLVEVRG